MRTVVIVGGGLSLDPGDIDFLQGTNCDVIAVNNAYQILPWGDYLYARDFHWWNTVAPDYCRIEGGQIVKRPNVEGWTHAQRAAREFAGERWTGDPKAAHALGLCGVTTRTGGGLCSIPGIIHEGPIGGGNSGYQAINQALHWGYRKILLYAFDMGATGAGHWHGEHPGKLTNLTAQQFDPFARGFGTMLPVLADMSAEVVNCTRKSAITCFRFSTLRDELQRVTERTGSATQPYPGHP